MNRLAKIRHNFTHRRSKSDSQLFNDWSSDCLQLDDDEVEDSPAIMAVTSFGDDPFTEVPDHVSPRTKADCELRSTGSADHQKSGSTSSLDFLANFASSFRKKLASDGNLLTSPTPDDSAKLHADEDPAVFSYDNDGLRKSAVFEANEAEKPPEEAAPAELAWVTFDDDFPPANPAAEFVDIPLNEAEDGREDGTSNRLMQNLKKLPLRFMKNQRYKSLQPETGEEEEVFGDERGKLPIFRSSSLPNSPSMRKKLTSAFSNLKRQ